MRTKCYSAEQFRSRLTEWVGDKGTRTVCMALGIGPSYLSDLKLGRRNPSEAVLNAMGMTWAIVARPAIVPADARPEET